MSIMLNPPFKTSVTFRQKVSRIAAESGQKTDFPWDLLCNSHALFALVAELHGVVLWTDEGQ
jgi:hypothetical protein